MTSCQRLYTTLADLTQRLCHAQQERSRLGELILKRWQKATFGMMAIMEQAVRQCRMQPRSAGGVLKLDVHLSLMWLLLYPAPCLHAGQEPAGLQDPGAICYCQENLRQACRVNWSDAGLTMMRLLRAGLHITNAMSGVYEAVHPSPASLVILKRTGAFSKQKQLSLQALYGSAQTFMVRRSVPRTRCVMPVSSSSAESRMPGILRQAFSARALTSG